MRPPRQLPFQAAPREPRKGWRATTVTTTQRLRRPLPYSTLTLHDIRDVELYCRALMEKQLRQLGSRLNEHQREFLLQFLISECWRLSTKYDTTKSRLKFSTYCGWLLPDRMIDWYRSELGDSRCAPRPEHVSIDADFDVGERDLVFRQSSLQLVDTRTRQTVLDTPETIEEVEFRVAIGL